MHNSAHHQAFQPLQGEAVVVAPQSLQRLQLRQLLIVSLLVLLWSGFQPVKAEESKVLVDEPMLSRLYSTYGKDAYLRGLYLGQLLEQLRGADIRTKLMEINRFFNHFEYRSDIALWKTRDHWATPLQFLGKQGGDCEDFAISKYFALRALGVTDTHMSLTYAKSVSDGGIHMVLSYQDSDNSVPLILDVPGSAVGPATEYKNLIPVYGFNSSSIFLSKPNFAPGRTLPAGRGHNRKWIALLAAVKRHQTPILLASESPNPRIGS